MHQKFSSHRSHRCHRSESVSTDKLLSLFLLSSKTKYFFVIKNNFNNSNNIQRPNDLFHEVKKNDVSALVEKVSFLMSSIT